MKRKLLTLILFIGAILCCTLALSACGGDNNELHVHEWGEWVVTEAPTCIKGGKETRTCNSTPLISKRETHGIRQRINSFTMKHKRPHARQAVGMHTMNANTAIILLNTVN